MPIAVTDVEFDQEVLQANLPVLVDFWAPWCGPCQMIAPILTELAQQYRGRLKICKVNVDDSTVAASRYQIRSIPTLILFKAGSPVTQMVGVQPAAALARQIEPHLSPEPANGNA